jgi:hypothetical protein
MESSSHQRGAFSIALSRVSCRSYIISTKRHKKSGLSERAGPEGGKKRAV